MNYPPIANLNENTTIIIPGVVNQGNPNLTSNNEYGAFLRINHYSSWLQGQLTFFGVYTDSPMSVYYEWHTIKDNNRMVSIGVSWNFFSGKKKDIQKHINNRDGDSGAFK